MRSSQLFRTVVRFASAAGLLSCCALVSCQKADEKPEPNELEGVYVVGSVDDANTAVLWENGALRRLESGSHARSVAVAGKDVYAGGNEYNFDYDRWEARVWKNGVLQALDLGDAEYARLESLTVAEGNVYVLGFLSKGAGQQYDVPVVWKNGMLVCRLTDGNEGAMVSSIVVSGSDVYVGGSCGTADGPSVVTLWKNGAPQKLSDGIYSASLTALAISDGAVYAVGYEFRGDDLIGMLWRNGVPTQLCEASYRSMPMGVCVDGSDVYVAIWSVGGNGQAGMYAVLWKNGEMELLPAKGLADIRAVTVSKGHVYVTGHYDINAGAVGVWKDGKLIPLPGEGYATVFGIFVK